ncbi:MAG: DNA repair exonuclease [Candidatus Latescibacteria bacterium]|nr:DNA repair exonuclease [Candidatus Latescibacterota bacterium]
MRHLILHLAALHLGSGHSYLGVRAPERAREADAVLDRVADWVIEGGGSEVGAVLIAGDLFDTPRPPEPLAEAVVRALSRIEAAGVRVVTVPGNHDEWTYGDGVFRRWADSWPGILATARAPERVARFPLGDRTIEVVSCAFQQGRNPPPGSWEDPFAGEPKGEARRIGLFHGTLDAIGGIVAEGPRAFRIDHARLAGWGLDYLALGHIHKPETFRHGACLARYPGPIEGLGFDDPGARALTLVDLSAGEPVIRSFGAGDAWVRARAVATERIDLVGIGTAEALEARLDALCDPQAPQPILRVVLEGRPAFPLDPDEIRRRLVPRTFHLEIEGGGGETAPSDWEPLAGQSTLEGSFARCVLERRDRESDPDRRSHFDRVAAAGLRALGRDRT